MERILTKDEIAELLSAVQEGELDAELEPEPEVEVASTSKRKTVSLDLVRAHSAGRGRIANFDIILDAFARNLGTSLTSRLLRSVIVKREGIDTLEFDQLLQKTKGNGVIGVISLDPLKGAGLLVFDNSLSFTVVELMLGGGFESKVLPVDRPMTTIEVNVVKGVMSGACLDLQKAFRPIEELTPKLAKVETNPRMVNIAATDAEVVIANYSVAVDTLKGRLQLVIPYQALDPIKEKLRGGMLSIGANRGVSWTPQLVRELTRLDMDVSAQFGVVNLKIRDILNLRAGDIITMDCDPKKPVPITVEQKVKFMGQGGVRNGKKAVRKISRFTEGEEDGDERENG